MNRFLKIINAWNYLSRFGPLAFIVRLRGEFPAFSKERQKVFVIGMNKTGTTSVFQALRKLGYVMGDQVEAEHLMREVIAGEYSRLLSYCRKSEAFQDVPFSLPSVYKKLDEAFPGSKFILTVRDSPEQWYSSVERYYPRFWGSSGNTLQDMSNADYRGPGWIKDLMQHLFQDQFDDADYCMGRYCEHIEDIKRYFQDSDKLLVLNVSQQDSYRRMCAFLGRRPVSELFECLNRSKPIQESP